MEGKYLALHGIRILAEENNCFTILIVDKGIHQTFVQPEDVKKIAHFLLENSTDGASGHSSPY